MPKIRPITSTSDVPIFWAKTRCQPLNSGPMNSALPHIRYYTTLPNGDLSLCGHFHRRFSPLVVVSIKGADEPNFGVRSGANMASFWQSLVTMVKMFTDRNICRSTTQYRSTSDTQLKRPVTFGNCDSCEGTGVVPGEAMEGLGRSGLSKYLTIPESMPPSKTCPVCKGTGNVDREVRA